MVARLRAVSRTQGANAALKSGEILLSGHDLAFVEVSPLIKAFRHMVRALAYDICEMALTTYVCAKEHGVRFTAIPVFLVRAFHHGAIVVNAEAGIRSAKDLEGRKVGVNRGYTVTTGVWARSVLAAEHGVDLAKITWVLSGDEHVEAYRPPANVVPIGPGLDIVDLLISGELAAAVGVEAAHPVLRPLIPDPEAAGLAALETRGVWPINHLVVVRDDVLCAHPGLGPALFEAFAEAKRRYVAALEAATIDKPRPADETYRRVMAVIGDPLPYGVEPNRITLQALLDHAYAQRIITRKPRLEDLFDPATLGLTG